MDVALERFDLELVEPLSTADGSIEARSGYLVRVERGDSDEVVAGVGEATPLPGWTESLEACGAALERAAARLESSDRAAALAACANAPAARHGVSLALDDLAARDADVPLHGRLARSGTATCSTPSRSDDRTLSDDRPEATVPDAVPCNATVGDGSPAATADAARDAVEAGFDCLKVKVGAGPPDRDRERLRAVRDEVGSALDLRVDANGSWSASTAEAAAEWLADCGVGLVEQPLPAAELARLSELDFGPVAVAADESVVAAERRDADVATGATGTDALDSLLTLEGLDALVLKPTALGGPERAIAIGERARAAGLDAVVTTTVDAVVARSAAVHVAAALAPLPHCGLATAGRLASDLASDPAPVTDGAASVPAGPGTGVALDELPAFDAE